MSTRIPPHPDPPAGHSARPTTTAGRRALRALGASVLFLVVSAVVLNTAGQGLVAGLLGGVCVAFALAAFVLGGAAILRDRERSPAVFAGWVVALLVLVAVLHSLVISD